MADAEEKPQVFRAADQPPPPGPPTPGMDRREIVNRDETWIGWVETAPGFAGGWHHHGERASYIYVIRGELRMEYGPGGGEAVTGRAGDVIVNPPHVVHREITPGESIQAIVIRVGPGPLNVNVDGPDG
jgi:quercetin dioxygenase-like cupin family protein